MKRFSFRLIVYDFSVFRHKGEVSRGSPPPMKTRSEREGTLSWHGRLARE